MELSLTDLEQAINYWRQLHPALGEEHTLSPEVNRLATLYALMIYHRARSVPVAQVEGPALQLIEQWRTATAQRTDHEHKLEAALPRSTAP